MKKLAKSLAVLTLLALSSLAAAQTLTGTVTNGTSGKPAAGDEIILINLSNGMEVAAKTKADSSGKFSFKLTDSGGPHLIRAVHQGVTYHQMAPPGTNSVEVQVYDVARKVADLSMTADVLRLQADSGTLQATRLFAVSNASVPARTQMNDHNFEFYLPEGAKLESAQAKAPNGQPIAAEATPQSEKNRYAIAFPLRPGETQFQVQFTLPYSGTIKIDPKPLYPAQHVVVVLPKTMQFTAANPSQFQSMQDSSQGDTVVQVAQQTQAGQSLGFTVSGTGTISESSSQVASGAAQGQGRDNRPGGGLGVPIDAPDPLQQYRWPILIGFALVLAVGAWVVMKRQPATAVAPAATASIPDPRLAPRASAAAAVATPPVASAPAAKASMILEALKEEMFQLELERKQGKITPAEYEKAKAALDQTLDRALKRQG
ncbi:MAG: carboxypeptidase regulatory-like domain-containing protein [Acidobacteriales bacterium]|nr:carboxypeptidase regulatory-like domain-containing protein [Candidatus Koribacter versatilis]MBI3646930.1 carboxypeptidase regulatory-like domain-containing protein [Terriglobales bacterium]